MQLPSFDLHIRLISQNRALRRKTAEGAITIHCAVSSFIRATKQLRRSTLFVSPPTRELDMSDKIAVRGMAGCTTQGTACFIAVQKSRALQPSASLHHEASCTRPWQTTDSKSKSRHTLIRRAVSAAAHHGHCTAVDGIWFLGPFPKEMPEAFKA